MIVTDAGETYVVTADAVYTYDVERGGLETTFEPDVEPLAAECRAFRDAVDGERAVAIDGAFGVTVLERDRRYLLTSRTYSRWRASCA